MMGTGKTTVGEILTRRIGTYSHLDTDQLLERASHQTISQLFAKDGETIFRQSESTVLQTVHAQLRCVVSTGGGLPCTTSNWGTLRGGIVTWLDVPAKVLYERLRRGKFCGRPLLSQTDDPYQTLVDLCEKRREIYAQADVHVEIDDSMDEEVVVDKMVQQIHEFLDSK